MIHLANPPTKIQPSHVHNTRQATTTRDLYRECIISMIVACKRLCAPVYSVFVMEHIQNLVVLNSRRALLNVTRSNPLCTNAKPQTRLYQLGLHDPLA